MSARDNVCVVTTTVEAGEKLAGQAGTTRFAVERIDEGDDGRGLVLRGRLNMLAARRDWAQERQRP